MRPKARAAAKAEAYAPAHITGFFKIHSSGSSGAGINLEKGMHTGVSVAKGRGIEISINGKRSAAPLSRRVAREMLKRGGGSCSIRVSHTTEMPMGHGLGISGAGAFSLALALSRALGLGLSRERCMRIARDAEIAEGTGLGDVPAQMRAGAMYGKATRRERRIRGIPVSASHVVMGFFGPIKTKKIIRSREWKQKINRAGDAAMKGFLGNISESSFLTHSRIFSQESGLAKGKVLKAMAEFPSGSMAMLGNTVFVLTSRPGAVKRKMKKFIKNVSVSRIAETGAHTL